MKFAPIAIVGRACRVPGASSPEALWRLVEAGESALSEAPAGRWRAPDSDVVSETATEDHAYSKRGGYVEGERAADSEQGGELDPVFTMSRDVVREALQDAGGPQGRVGLVMGNLGFPSEGHSRFAETHWLGERSSTLGIEARPEERFHSGLPAHFIARELGFAAGGYSLDAACASSLYAIELACRSLQEGRSDMMVAGAVNRADDLFIHVGFSALGALSASGQSRPFDADADGLLPGEGAAFVTLMRLDDARRDGRVIHGVIRGVGLANDGRGRGLLAPTSGGQVMSMTKALTQAGLRAKDVPYVECHATGTQVGDATELASLAEAYGESPLVVGSLKANLGHLITAAGAAGLIKVLEAMRHDVFPMTPGVTTPTPALSEAGCRLAGAGEAWSGPKRAAVSAFGFGGNDAHLIVEDVSLTPMAASVAAPFTGPLVGRLAIIGLGARVGSGQNAAGLLGGCGPRAESVTLPLRGLRFPPNDLKHTLAQQTLLLAAAFEALDGLKLPGATTGVYIGMGCDSDVTRYGARWRAKGWSRRLGESIDGGAFIHGLKSAGVIGTMPNIPANRLSSQFDLRGPSFTFSAEEGSGAWALAAARRALLAGEIDMALVGAVDIASDDVTRAALAALGREDGAADGAVLVALVREGDAPSGSAYALLEETSAEGPVSKSPLPRAHAAAFMVDLAHAAATASASGKGATLRVSPLGAPQGTTPAFTLLPVRDPKALSSWQATPPVLTRPVHYPQVSLPPVAHSATSATAVPQSTRARTSMQSMAPAPTLPSVFNEAPTHTPTPAAAPVVAPVATPVAVPVRTLAVPATMPAAIPAAIPAMPTSQSSLQVAALGNYQAKIAAMHRAFVEQQVALHQQFLAMQAHASQSMMQMLTQAPAPAMSAPMHAMHAMPSALPAAAPAQAPLPVSAPLVRAPASVPVAAKPVAAKPVAAKPVAAKPVAAKPVAAKPVAAKPVAAKPASGKPAPIGPTFDRAALAIHAGGRISEIFGAEFEQQDVHEVQVRMPEPPLLLADRVTGIDAEPGSMKKGTVWTETDVLPDSWYLHRGRMPAGVMIESGQADLFLISYLGVDFLNRGERAYRLLGCELTYHGGLDTGSLPKIGETLCYDIHVDGHANQGDIRLFFFHYDCELRLPDGSLRPALSVRNGQAGFFTKEELAESAGVLWSPEEQDIVENPRLDAPAVNCTKTSFTEEDLAAFAAGDVPKCFGPGFEYAAPHNRTPRIAGHGFEREPATPAGELAKSSLNAKRMHFFDRVDECLPQGGPWGRGYLRATLDIAPSDWFFVGHFKNDPCMPGTLMFEGCLQAMATFVTSLGFTLDKDGWRFEPVPEEKYELRCRGQVLPSSKKLTYEIFVEEVIEGPIPTLYADLLCTVDGLKAFHARRMALRLVPDWPLEEWRKSPPADADPSCAPALTSEVQDAIVMLDKPAPAGQQSAASAVWALDPQQREFVFDYASLLACAWGRPSEAFGPMYEIFDSTRRVARLPGPPYHFMSRVTRIDGELGVCKPGAEIEIAYDVPESIWYFNENAQAVMPFAVLLEAALQPCGWLASFVGSALTVGDKDVSFRNLDGTGTVLTEVFPSMGTFRTVVKITNVSSTAGMIIESFDVMSYVDHADGTSTPAYKLKTVFGFFPGAALENQIGLSTTDEQRALLESRGTPGSEFAVDLTPRPERYCAGSLRMAEPMLLMVDRITACDAKGGSAGLGFVRGEKDVDPAEWFFKAHFFQDPVQPGSLGIEAFLQLMQFFAIDQNLGEGMKAPRFEAIAIGHEHSWKYRGQVVPKNKVIGSTVEILEVSKDERGIRIVGAASLWVDGKRIYEAPAIGIRVVDGIDGTPNRPKAEAGRSPASQLGSGLATHSVLHEETLSLESTPWVKDHCPTFSVAALPLMTLVDRFVAAANLDPASAQLRDVRVMRWVTVAPDATIRVEQHGDELRLMMWREAADAKLSRFEVAATARVGTPAPMLDLAPLEASELSENPYENGSLFHGDAFRLLKELRVGPGGADAWLDATSPTGANGSVPIGAVHQALLDAATHAIPHDALHTWSDAIPDDVVAYPYELELSFCGPLPTGRVKCSARLEEVRTEPRLLPVIRIDLFDEERNAMWARLRMTEVLLPKGPLGSAPRDARLQFMREREYVQGVGLSEATTAADGSASHRAHRDTVSQSGWLPGTVQSLYESSATTLDALTSDVSTGDHIAAEAKCHPSQVGVRNSSGRTFGFDRARPLRSFPFVSSVEREHTTTTSNGDAFVDLSEIEDFWAERFGLREWPIADLYYGLCKQFVKDVVIEDPDAFDAIRGQSALFLGNHQTGIESLLFGILAGGLQKTPILTLAKDAHRESWLGRLIALGFEYPGAHDPGVIAFFNREDPASLPRIVKSLSSMASSSSRDSQRSLLVHVEGTRQLSASQPMNKMSGVFVDLALVANLPIVPVSFSGGLPIRPLNERIEFPIGLGQQTFSLGKPLLPDELRGLPYKERTERVLSAIGNQRPKDELPGPPLSDLSTRVGAITPQRVARAVLESLEDPCEATKAALAGEDLGGPEGEWLRSFGAWLNS